MTEILVITIKCKATVDLFGCDFSDLPPEQQELFRQGLIKCESGKLGTWCIYCQFGEVYEDYEFEEEDSDMALFADWYARTQTGENRMYSEQRVRKASPGLSSDHLRARWYASDDKDLQALAGIATDLLLLYDYYLGQEKRPWKEER